MNKSALILTDQTYNGLIHPGIHYSKGQHLSDIVLVGLRG